MENTENQNSEQPASSEPVQIKEENSVDTNTTDVDATSKGADANAGDKKTVDETVGEKPNQVEEDTPKPTGSTTLISCANCNSKIQEIKVQGGRDVEVDHLLNEALMTPFTMEVCDDDEQSDKITATVEITVFEALVELFALRNKSPHLIPLLEKVMKKNSIESANALELGSQEPGKQMKLLSLCTDCTDRIANLYELYKEFTLLSMKSNSFFSRILGSSNSGSFAKTNIKTVPVPKSVQQKRNNGTSSTSVIPEVIIEDDHEESMDYSANQTYSDNDEDGGQYTMDVETVYGQTNAKTVSSRGRVVTDHTSKGSGMFSEAAGSGTRRVDTKRSCKRCGKVYYYTTSYEKHVQNCTGPDLRIGSVSGNNSKRSLVDSDEDNEEAEEISILPDIHIDNSYASSGSGSYSTSTHITMYKCKHCNKACQNISALQKHERTHGTTSSPTTSCKPCGKTFGSVYDLRRHYQTNTHKQRIRDGAGVKPASDSWSYSGY